MTASDCDRAFMESKESTFDGRERKRERERIYACKDVTFDRLSSFSLDAINCNSLIFSRKRER